MLVVEVNYNYMLKLSNNDSFPSSIVISIIVTVRGPLAVQLRRIDIQYNILRVNLLLLNVKRSSLYLMV